MTLRTLSTPQEAAEWLRTQVRGTLRADQMVGVAGVLGDGGQRGDRFGRSAVEGR